MNSVQQYERLKQELNEALAQRAQCDEKIVALRNVLQGVGLGVELQRQADREAPQPEPAKPAE